MWLLSEKQFDSVTTRMGFASFFKLKLLLLRHLMSPMCFHRKRPAMGKRGRVSFPFGRAFLEVSGTLLLYLRISR